MIETSPQYPLVALVGSITIVYITLNVIWNGSF